MMTRFAVCALVACFLVPPSAAAAGHGPVVSYRGALADESGEPAQDGRYAVVFSLYDSEDSDQPVWTETQNVNLVDGAYEALIGGENPIAVEGQEEMWFEVRQAGDEAAPRSRVLILMEGPIGTKDIRDKAVTAAKLEEGLGLKLAYNSSSDSSTTEARTEVVLKEFTLKPNSFSSTLMVQVTGEAYAFEGHLNVYIAGKLEKSMHLRTSEAPWAPYWGAFSGCTIVKRNLDWSKPIEIKVVGYLPVSMPGLEPTQHVTCNSLTVMGS